MSEPRLPITGGLSIIAEPDGDFCRLTIRLPWDALEELLASVVGLIEPYKRAEGLRKRQNEDAKSDKEDRIAAAKALGAKILAEIVAKQAEGLSLVGATKAVAAEQNISPFIAGVFARIARKDACDARDSRILAAVQAGKRNREIAEAEGLATATVSRILRQLRDQAGAAAMPLRKCHPRDQS